MIPTLPEEILVSIFEHLRLPSADSFADFYSRTQENYRYDKAIDSFKTDLSRIAHICRCSQAFNRLAEPILYRIFPAERLVDPCRFVNALTSRPNRALLVREIIANHSEVERYDDIIRLIDRNVHRFNDDLEDTHESGDHGVNDAAGIDEDTDTSDEGFGGHDAANINDTNHHAQLSLASRSGQTVEQQAAMATMVSLCRRVETLIFRHCGLFISDILNNALFDHAQAITKAPENIRGSLPLGCLRRLNYSGDYEMERDPAASLLDLQTLRQVSLCGVDIALEKQSLASSLEAFESLDCVLKEGTIDSLLTMCADLKSVKLTFMSGLDAHDLHCAGPALRQKGRSLEFLHVSVDDSDMRDMDSASGVPKHELHGLGSLHELSSLKKLEITPWIIAGISKVPDPDQRLHLDRLLPASLEVLILFHTRVGGISSQTVEDQRIVRAIEGVLSSDKLPRLRRVDFSVNRNESAPSHPDWTRRTRNDRLKRVLWHIYTK